MKWFILITGIICFIGSLTLSCSVLTILLCFTAFELSIVNFYLASHLK